MINDYNVRFKGNKTKLIFVRLGIGSTHEYIKSLNSRHTIIQEIYQNKLANLVKSVKIKVMLDDSTIIEQNTFDPALIKEFYQNLVKKLSDWTVQDVVISNNDDLRRIFTKFEIREGNYILSGHLSTQFHVLLYYKSDYGVVKCQKELEKIIEQTKKFDTSVTNTNEEFVKKHLKEIGYNNVNDLDLFELFFKNNELCERIYTEIGKNTDVDFQELAKKKIELFNELNNFLIETYQTTNVLIDDTRLISGEEGILCTFDIEFVKNKTKEGFFDPKKIPSEIQEKLYRRLDDFSKFLNSIV